MEDPLKDMSHKKYIPTIYAKMLKRYERGALGLNPDEDRMMRMFIHGTDRHMCIHVAELSISGRNNRPTITVTPESVGRQPFDLGGYYLNPEMREDNGQSESNFGL